MKRDSSPSLPRKWLQFCTEFVSECASGDQDLLPCFLFFFTVLRPIRRAGIHFSIFSLSPVFFYVESSRRYSLDMIATIRCDRTHCLSASRRALIIKLFWLFLIAKRRALNVEEHMKERTPRVGVGNSTLMTCWKSPCGDCLAKPKRTWSYPDTHTKHCKISSFHD